MAKSAALPSFTGLMLHREPTLGYSFFVPDGWHRREIEGGGDFSVLYAPSTDDAFTSFSAEGQDLGVEVKAEDLPALREGARRGIRKLPGSRITQFEAEAIGRLITIEARHTYRDGEAVRARWVRLLYQGTVQVRLIAQAASVEQFEYWLPMFYESMRTFRFGDWGLDAGVASDDWQK